MPTAIQGSLSVRVTADGYRTRAIRQGLHGLVWLNAGAHVADRVPAGGDQPHNRRDRRRRDGTMVR
jgi:hypothetical protein